MTIALSPFDLSRRAAAEPADRCACVRVAWPGVPMGDDCILVPGGWFTPGATFTTVPFRRPAFGYRSDRDGA